MGYKKWEMKVETEKKGGGKGALHMMITSCFRLLTSSCSLWRNPATFFPQSIARSSFELTPSSSLPSPASSSFWWLLLFWCEWWLQHRITCWSRLGSPDESQVDDDEGDDEDGQHCVVWDVVEDDLVDGGSGDDGSWLSSWM